LKILEISVLAIGPSMADMLVSAPKKRWSISSSNKQWL